MMILCALFSTTAPAKADKPNLVIFLVDDMGLMDTSVPALVDDQGNPKRHPLNDWYRTPNMERLAAQCVRFSNFYSHNLCSATRISIMTGQNAARHHTTDWINPYQNNKDMESKQFPREITQHMPPEWNWEGLKKGNITLPAILKQTGYTTIPYGQTIQPTSKCCRSLDLGRRVSFGRQSTPTTVPCGLIGTGRTTGATVAGTSPGSGITVTAANRWAGHVWGKRSSSLF